MGKNEFKTETMERNGCGMEKSVISLGGPWEIIEKR